MRDVEARQLTAPDAADGQDEVRPLHVGEVVGRMNRIRPLKEVGPRRVWTRATTSVLEERISHSS